MSTMKYSRQRECIKQNIKSRLDHPTAEMVYQDVRKEFPNISLGTVYRNLTLLVEHGEIIKISCGEEMDRFDGRTSQHYHFVCRKCGSVTDLLGLEMSHINVLAANGFEGEIEGHFAYFYGLCPKCK